MRIKTTETPVYTWDELSESAKDHARQKWSEFLWNDGSMQEDMQLIFDGKMEDLGWEPTGKDGDLSYALYMQGGYPAFSVDIPDFQHDGRSYVVHVRNARDYFEVTVEESDDDPDVAYGTPEWDAEVKRIEAVEEAVKDKLRDVSHELYEAFVKEDEYQVSDEQMAETSEANGYEYDENGDLA